MRAEHFHRAIAFQLLDLIVWDCFLGILALVLQDEKEHVVFPLQRGGNVQQQRERLFIVKRRAQCGNLSCLSWKWRKRSSVKITERTYEERAQALHC